MTDLCLWMLQVLTTDMENCVGILNGLVLRAEILGLEVVQYGGNCECAGRDTED